VFCQITVQCESIARTGAQIVRELSEEAWIYREKQVKNPFFLAR
jgi:hypothetical protein